jgi:hypothetical protein
MWYTGKWFMLNRVMNQLSERKLQGLMQLHIFFSLEFLRQKFYQILRPIYPLTAYLYFFSAANFDSHSAHVPLNCVCSYASVQLALICPPRNIPNLGLGLPLDLRYSVGLLGRVISSSQGLYLYTNKEKRTYTNRHPYPEWNSNPRSRRPSERRQCMP